MTDFDEIRKRILNNEITICESCGEIFEYVPRKKYCNQCREKKRIIQSTIHVLQRNKNRRILKKNKRDYVDGAWRKHNEYEEEEYD